MRQVSVTMVNSIWILFSYYFSFQPPPPGPYGQAPPPPPGYGIPPPPRGQTNGGPPTTYPGYPPHQAPPPPAVTYPPRPSVPPDNGPPRSQPNIPVSNCSTCKSILTTEMSSLPLYVCTTKSWWINCVFVLQIPEIRQRGQNNRYFLFGAKTSYI